MLPETKIKRRN